ncbi:MAG: protein-export chaperone SecB [Pseudomonadota bacterium]
MSDTPSPNDANGSSPSSAGGTDPKPGGTDPKQGVGLRVLAQYLKDLSFESPRAPNIFAQQQNPPHISVNVDVNARAIGETQYEVELTVGAKATGGDDAIFVAETTYAGAFEIIGVPKDQVEPILLIECPRLLFPFLRQVLAETTQAGNFPPVMLDPIDFFSIYEQRKREANKSPQNVQFTT